MYIYLKVQVTIFDTFWFCLRASRSWLKFLIHFDCALECVEVGYNFWYILNCLRVCRSWLQFLIHFDFALEYVEVGYTFWYIFILPLCMLKLVTFFDTFWFCLCVCWSWLQILIHFNFALEYVEVGYNFWYILNLPLCRRSKFYLNFKRKIWISKSLKFMPLLLGSIRMVVSRW